MLDSTIAGGQTWLHKMRMAKQVLFKATCFALAISSIFLVYQGTTIHKDVYNSLWYWTKAVSSKKIGFQTINVDASFWKKASKEQPKRGNQHKPENVIKVTEPIVYRFKEYFLRQLAIAFFLFLGAKTTALLFFSYLGKEVEKKKTLSGGKIIPSWKSALKIKSMANASPIKIGSIPMIKGTETRHMMITGGTGAGKTNCLKTIIPQIRKEKHPMVIVDTTGEFVEKYYREGKDILLNPYDERSVQWHPWAECDKEYDYDTLAESLIPQSNQATETFWRQAATMLLTSVLKKTSRSQKTSLLVNWLLYETLENLCGFLIGTKAASVVDFGSEKTAASVRSVASTFVSCLETIKDTETPFSIRKWIEEEKEDSCLFLYCKPEQRSNMRPLLSCWFSIATNSLLRKQPDFNRRIWFIIDELRSLQKLPQLETFVVEARKYGGCGIFSLQSPSQLIEMYGRASTEIILGNCQTKIVFNENEPKTAKLISEFFGETEIEEIQKGKSFGSNDMRDGVSLSSQKRKQLLVSASEIQNLKANRAYLRLPGSEVVSKVRFPIQKY